MRIGHLHLKNYRNYKNLDIDLNPGLNIFIGNNAQGKSNILESIFVLALTKSYMNIKDQYLINENEEFSLIKANYSTDTVENNLEIVITSNQKKLKINGVEIKKYCDYISKIKVLIFSPQNDVNFVKAYISDRINLSNDGPDKIRKSLLEHDISSDIIDENIDKIDNNLIKEKLSKLISKKISNTKYSGYVLRQKIVNDFVNLGYSRQLINEVYESINIDKNDLLKKEYDKLYKKLSIKYSGYELESKIKTKLYQKGFTMDEINNI